jgi:hypothetical protein
MKSLLVIALLAVPLSASSVPISDPVGNPILDPQIPIDVFLQAETWYGVVDENTAGDLVCYGDICAPLWEPWPEPEAIYPAPYHPPVPKGVSEVPEPHCFLGNRSMAETDGVRALRGQAALEQLGFILVGPVHRKRVPCTYEIEVSGGGVDRGTLVYLTEELSEAEAREYCEQAGWMMLPGRCWYKAIAE